MRNQAVKHGAQAGLFLGAQAAKNVLVAFRHHGHGTLKHLAPGGPQGQDHAAPIARVIDLDPDFLSRLQAERAQKVAEIAATEAASATAQRDVKRMTTLYGEGLAARRWASCFAVIMRRCIGTFCGCRGARR